MLAYSSPPTRLRARPTHLSPVAARRLIRNLFTHQAALEQKIESLTPKPIPPDPPKTVNGLRALVAGLQKPSDCADLITNANGPTVFWLAVRQFGVKIEDAEFVKNLHPTDWSAALCALDKVQF